MTMSEASTALGTALQVPLPVPNLLACLPTGLPACPQDAAQNGVLRSPAALALNVGTLLAGLVHVRVLLPVLASEWAQWRLADTVCPRALVLLACLPRQDCLVGCSAC